MEPVFMHSYPARVKEDGLIIARPHRGVLKEGAVLSTDKDGRDKFLTLYPTLPNPPPRNIYAASFDAKRGVVHIPREFTNYASIEDSALTIGVGNSIEFWNPQLWQEYFFKLLEKLGEDKPKAKVRHNTLATNHVIEVGKQDYRILEAPVPPDNAISAPPYNDKAVDKASGLVPAESQNGIVSALQVPIEYEGRDLSEILSGYPGLIPQGWGIEFIHMDDRRKMLHISRVSDDDLFAMLNLYETKGGFKIRAIIVDNSGKSLARWETLSHSPAASIREVGRFVFGVGSAYLDGETNIPEILAIRKAYAGPRLS